MINHRNRLSSTSAISTRIKNCLLASHGSGLPTWALTSSRPSSLTEFCIYVGTLAWEVKDGGTCLQSKAVLLLCSVFWHGSTFLHLPLRRRAMDSKVTCVVRGDGLRREKKWSWLRVSCAMIRERVLCITSVTFPLSKITTADANPETSNYSGFIMGQSFWLRHVSIWMS
jgi:hypothetical protein